MTLREKVIRSGNPAALSAFVLGDMENAVIASIPGGIEAQETRGQATLTRQFSQLPKKYIGQNGTEFPVGLLKRLGFTIQAPVDDLFVGVTAPAGWQLRPTSHSMHNEIVDDKGRVRGGVFYKAAFYIEGHNHPTTAEKYNLPTVFGALCGVSLANSVDYTKACGGCAYRLGTCANQSDSTTCDAEWCQEEAEAFMCHERLDDNGKPTTRCIGYALHQASHR